MDPKLIFWTGSLVNMAVIVVLAGAGVAQRRRGDIARHRRSMLGAAALVVLFLVAYALKLLFLGREEMESWSRASVWILRIHETCVATLLLAGGMAAWRALSLRRTRNASLDPADPPAPPALARQHRRAGWLAVVASALGLATALLVLLGMYDRAGLL